MEEQGPNAKMASAGSPPCGAPACGSRSCAAGLRALRTVPPAIKQVAADAEFFGDLGNRFACAQKFNGLRLELGGVSLAVD